MKRDIASTSAVDHIDNLSWLVEPNGSRVNTSVKDGDTNVATIVFGILAEEAERLCGIFGKQATQREGFAWRSTSRWHCGGSRRSVDDRSGAAEVWGG